MVNLAFYVINVYTMTLSCIDKFNYACKRLYILYIVFVNKIMSHNVCVRNYIE